MRLAGSANLVDEIRADDICVAIDRRDTAAMFDWLVGGLSFPRRVRRGRHQLQHRSNVVCQANDPYGEHDFGSFEADGHVIYFKIDCLDKALTHHSPDPSDPSVTERVITITLADEY